MPRATCRFRREVVRRLAGQPGVAPALSGSIFCRCGHSANKPFCDNSHKRVGLWGNWRWNLPPLREGNRI
ncbi:CDGSH iron-sulfur domain-containing protein [Mesorhizobium temperatum]|uniref:CDGSH iron-sulfur domain-containing protein n=1 Tax=Mesorhizobium temperatum TaxID=241416 RepID=UPI00117E5C72